MPGGVAIAHGSPAWARCTLHAFGRIRILAQVSHRCRRFESNALTSVVAVVIGVGIVIDLEC